MAHAALIVVDNSTEDPDVGRAGLRDELMPALRAMPGFQAASLLTDYPRGREAALVVFEFREQADALARSVAVGHALRDGVTVISSEVFEVTVSE
jgi:hypothetical protein